MSAKKKASAALVPRVAAELGLPAAGVAAVCALLDEGATVPFIARYRKEPTGGLDEVAIRAIEEKRVVPVGAGGAPRGGAGLDRGAGRAHRRAARAHPGRDQQGGARGPVPAVQAQAADARRHRARARAGAAGRPHPGPAGARRSAGRGGRRSSTPSKGVPGRDEALAGARDIVAERWPRTPRCARRCALPSAIEGDLVVEVVPAKRRRGDQVRAVLRLPRAGAQHPVAPLPGHPARRDRGCPARAHRRRRRAGPGAHRAACRAAARSRRSPASSMLAARDASSACSRPASRTRCAPSSRSARTARRSTCSPRTCASCCWPRRWGRSRCSASTRACAPAASAPRSTRPASFLGHVTIYPSHGDAGREKARRELLEFVRRHTPSAIAVGNGTGGRETEAFVREVLRDAGVADLIVVQVSEAGRQRVLRVRRRARGVPGSRPDRARRDLDRAPPAGSAGRAGEDRAQGIGVGQYQHDVHQPLLGKRARRGGRDLRQPGRRRAQHRQRGAAVVRRRHRPKRWRAASSRTASETGAFRARAELLDVAGVGPQDVRAVRRLPAHPGRARTRSTSAVHPERYALVERMARRPRRRRSARWSATRRWPTASTSAATSATAWASRPCATSCRELEKPGRDPRAEFEPPTFRDDVRELEDLAAGMVLEGVVTNVTAFGAFVDVGVHQDGLVHVSQLSRPLRQGPGRGREGRRPAHRARPRGRPRAASASRSPPARRRPQARRAQAPPSRARKVASPSSAASRSEASPSSAASPTSAAARRVSSATTRSPPWARSATSGGRPEGPTDGISGAKTTEGGPKGQPTVYLEPRRRRAARRANRRYIWSQDDGGRPEGPTVYLEPRRYVWSQDDGGQPEGPTDGMSGAKQTSQPAEEGVGLPD